MLHKQNKYTLAFWSFVLFSTVTNLIYNMIWKNIFVNCMVHLESQELCYFENNTIKSTKILISTIQNRLVKINMDTSRVNKQGHLLLLHFSKIAKSKKLDVHSILVKEIIESGYRTPCWQIIDTFESDTRHQIAHYDHPKDLICPSQ